MNSPGQDSSDLKESNTPPDSHGNDNRRRKPAANGRGVNTLSKEALDKKRDNDRKAQAAIRRRQKEEVANLKAQIDQLSAQKPFQELKSAVEEKDAIKREYDKLREALHNFVDSIQPLINPNSNPIPNSNPGIHELAAAARQNAQAALATSVPHSDPNLHHPPIDHAGYPGQGPGSGSGSGSSSFPSTSHDTDGISPSLPQRGPMMNDQRDLVQRHHQLNKDESLDFSFLFHASDASRRNIAQPRRHPSLSIASVPQQSNSGSYDHLWSKLPLISPPETPLDQLLTDFIRAHQQPTSSPRSATYPTNPSILHLLNPLDSTASSGSASPDLSRHMRESMNNMLPQPDALSSYMTRLVTWFEGLRGLPEKVAVCYIMYGVLRWQTYPTPENYRLMPEWMRPVPSQLTIYHPAWFDHIPFPEMRDKMLRGPHDRYRFGRTWFESWTEGLSVNWPFSESTCLANTGKDGQEEISPVFLEHISRLESWTMSSAFFNNFNELRGTAPIKDKVHEARSSHATNGHMPPEPRNPDMNTYGNHGQYPSYDTRRYSSNGRRDTGG